jgi:hypothetical protein
MTSESLFVLAVSVLTLGGVFIYLVRIEALAKKLEERVRDDELDSPIQNAPLASANGLETPASREMPR